MKCESAPGEGRKLTAADYHMTPEKAWKHLCTITRHKMKVAEGCFQVGLYRQGLLHDLSKYSPVEFLAGAKYYQGTRSPNNAEREATGRSLAWLHHKGRNRHHYEYWIDYATRPSPGFADKPGLVGCKMPGRYVIEMFMDRVAASKIYRADAYVDSDPLKYYEQGSTRMFMHPDTADLLEKLLRMLAEEGEEKTFRYIREHLYYRQGKRRVFLEQRLQEDPVMRLMTDKLSGHSRHVREADG